MYHWNDTHGVRNVALRALIFTLNTYTFCIYLCNYMSKLRQIFFIISLFADNKPGDNASCSSISNVILNSSRSSR